MSERAIITDENALKDSLFAKEVKLTSHDFIQFHRSNRSMKT
jgi:hypothetical protein